MKRKEVQVLAAVLIGSMLLGNVSLTAAATETGTEAVAGKEAVEVTQDIGDAAVVTAAADEVTDAELATVKAGLQEILAQKAVMATVYLTDNYPVKESADINGVTVAELPSGSQVLLRDVEIIDGCVWYQVGFGYEDVEMTGFMEAEYLVSSDADFLAWEESSLFAASEAIEEALVRAGNEDVMAFPESYRTALLQLKAQHPNWTFVPMNVSVSFSTAVTEEMRNDRSWVYYTKGDAWKGEARGTNWYLATQAAVEYCLDPRNFLTENNIFMFEQLTYNAGYHTADAVQDILKNSFMKGQIPGDTLTYAQAFYNIGQGMNVSPFHLACRVYQEQGSAGTSPLISGTYTGYEGYYNYFNVGASGVTNTEVITAGLTYAKDKGWNTIVKSLSGGAEMISKNYILKGQDTLYLQKFDVDPSYHGMFSHQYQQNITAPITEGAQIKRAYTSAGALNNSFVFKIPVYQDMPIYACPEPGTSTTPNYTQEQIAQLRAFIVRLYEQALGRVSYTDAEIDGWCQLLMKGESNGAEVAKGFFFSEEFKAKQVSDAEFVDLLYSVMFDSFPDAVGRKFWLSKLELGMSRDYIYWGFANSDQFTAVCGNYGVNRGTVTLDSYRDKNEGVTAFVMRLYSKLLGRRGDDTGMETWCRIILRKEDTVENVAYGFVFSEEFIRKETTNEEFIKLMYRTFLDREYDAPGLEFWMAEMDKGMDREEIFRGFARSVEFTGLMAQYGVTN